MARPKTIPLDERLGIEEQVRYRAEMMKVPYWTGEETALFLGVKRQALYQMVHDGKIKRVTGHGGPNMYGRDDILAFLERHNKPICEKLMEYW